VNDSPQKQQPVMKQNTVVETEIKVRIPHWKISPTETWTHWSTGLFKMIVGGFNNLSYTIHLR